MSTERKHEEEKRMEAERKDRLLDLRSYLLVAAAIIAAMVLWGFLLLSPAKAHDAPLGWSYPSQCCSGVDCRQVNNTPEEEAAGASKEKVLERQGGYLVQSSNEFVPWNDRKVKPSPDGRMHLCTHGGRPTGGVICLFVPDKGY